MEKPGLAGAAEAPAAGDSAIAYKLGTLVLLLLVGAAGYVGYSQSQYHDLGEVLAADIATYQRQRWDRPVLRGKALDKNAAEEELALAQQLPLLTGTQRSAFAEHLHYVKPLDAMLKALVSEHRITLAKLRAATRHPYAMTVIDVAQGKAASVPDYPRVMDAALMLLSTGLSYDARGCLELGVDVLRIGQDLVPGAPLEAASVSMRIASVAMPLLTTCAARAEHETLRRAASELHTLATHAPPVGTGIELSDVLARVELYQGGELFDGGDVLARLRQRSALFDQWAYFDNPSRWRKLVPARYPGALDLWRSELEHRNRAEHPGVSTASAGVLGWLYDDMRGQALLRALTVGLATLAEHKKRDRMPREPISLRDAALCDPFTGQPLRFRVSQDGSELTVWSVGEDLRDDKGSSDWSAQAPVDVVVRFALRVPEPEPKRARGKRRRRR